MRYNQKPKFYACVNAEMHVDLEDRFLKVSDGLQRQWDFCELLENV